MLAFEARRRKRVINRKSREGYEMERCLPDGRRFVMQVRVNLGWRDESRFEIAQRIRHARRIVRRTLAGEIAPPL